MRILVTGATGLLGHALVPVLQQSHQVIGLSSRDCDIRDEAATRRVLRAHSPDLVIHLAAYRDADGCELDPRRAEESNATGTRNVAQACAEISAAMVYTSTDYVFDGQQEEPYCEQDRPNPINIYGRSKLWGEQHVQAILERYFIVRTSWLVGPNGRSFVNTIIQLARRQEELRVVNDQRGSPTYTCHLASKLAELADTKAYGIYHITGSGSCTWFELAQTVVELCGLNGVRVVPISSEECGRPARRPAYSVLENRRLSLSNMGLLPHWKVGLTSFLDELRYAGDLECLWPGQSERTVTLLTESG